MKPKLPRKTSRDVDQISSSTWNQLIDCLAYAMDNPCGDGTTILNMGQGILRIGKISGNSAGSNMQEYSGPFCVGTKIQNEIWKVKLYDGGDPEGSVAGYITGGIRKWAIPSQSFDLPTGISYAQLYAEVSYNPETMAYTCGVHLTTSDVIPPSVDPRSWNCRIAAIHSDGIGYRINQLWENGDIEVTGRWLT